MELANIEKLVAKYENAETTLKEEAILKDYFLSGNVAPHLEEYQLMFAYFQTSQGETYNKSLEFKTQKKRNYKWLSVAASIVLLFSIYMGIPKTKEDPFTQMTAQEKFHYQQAEKALQLLSSNFYLYKNQVNLEK